MLKSTKYLETHFTKEKSDRKASHTCTIPMSLVHEMLLYVILILCFPMASFLPRSVKCWWGCKVTRILMQGKTCLQKPCLQNTFQNSSEIKINLARTCGLESTQLTRRNESMCIHAHIHITLTNACDNFLKACLLELSLLLKCWD